MDIYTGARVARTTPLFSNFLLTNLFSIKFLYYVIENKFVNRKLEKGGWSVPRAPVDIYKGEMAVVGGSILP